MKNKECLGLPPMIPMQHCNVKSFCGKQRWMSCCSLYCQELFFDCFRTGTYLSDSRETHAGWWSLLNCETAVYAERNLFVMSNFIVNHSVVVSLYTECTTGWMQKKKDLLGYFDTSDVGGIEFLSSESHRNQDDDRLPGLRGRPLTQPPHIL